MPSVTIGLNALRANPVRTVLSTLGVVMGVASLVAVLALGDGVEEFAREQLERTTSIQSIELRSRTTRELDGIQLPVTDYPVFTAADAQALGAAVPAAREVRLQVVGAGRVRLPGSDSLRGASVYGITGWPSLTPPPPWVAIAVAAAVTVGIGFGIYPALRAARLSPIDAIRHE